jgi:hypothetical protein
VFFFGIGLAGGTAYKFLYDNDSDEQLADQFTPPPSLPPLPQTAAADAAPMLAHLTPTAPPALAMPPAPLPVATVMARPPAPAPQTAPALPTPDAPTPDAQAAPALPAPVPYAAMTPAPPAPAATPRAIAQRHAAPPKKPRLAAKTAPAAPVATVALHEPPTAPTNVAGPFFVQFGAFANEENARRMQWAVEATGLKVEVSQAPGASGQMLFYLRSPIYHDYASALSAAQTVQDRVQHFVNAIPVDYAILGDHAAFEQQAQR